MLKYDSDLDEMWLRYIGDHQESNDEICFYIQQHLDIYESKENVDHTFVDFSQIELHRKIKILKNKEQQFDFDQNDIFWLFDTDKNSELDFPLNRFEQEFSQIDKYAISEIIHRFNKFYSQHIENQ